MYLSKVLITGSACRNPYEMHCALWRLFPKDKEATRDFLFRIGPANRTHAEILLQSETEPRHSHSTAKILACKEYRLALNKGQQLRFLLLANPIKTVRDETGRKNADGEIKKCRVPLIREEDQKKWIERKLQDAVSIVELAVEPLIPLRFYKTKEERAGKIKQVSFRGVLNVRNVEGFEKLIKKGVGPAKAFGCGLLSLARA